MAIYVWYINTMHEGDWAEWLIVSKMTEPVSILYRSECCWIVPGTLTKWDFE